MIEAKQKKSVSLLISCAIFQTVIGESVLALVARKRINSM